MDDFFIDYSSGIPVIKRRIKTDDAIKQLQDEKKRLEYKIQDAKDTIEKKNKQIADLKKKLEKTENCSKSYTVGFERGKIEGRKELVGFMVHYLRDNTSENFCNLLKVCVGLYDGKKE